MVAPKHRTHTGALDDLAEAVGYLMREAPEQALRFKARYREARRGLRRHPLAHGTLYDDYRRGGLVPFKYMIVYVTDGRSTDILAVLHAQRAPEMLRAELQGRGFD
ncbi:MAG: type II toxin-antitoxin system RelE/ParE family toxin [Cellulomonas sp.]|jgi:plasmid stabilization system protein ParE|nr:type II toxin-antitoxin system RelE/ParE family toxin [Cellulomonas sp.]